jgi:hypothetical protein
LIADDHQQGKLVKTLQRILIAAMMTGFALPAMAQAPPSYLILRSPRKPVHHVPQHYHGVVPPRAYGATVDRPTYAYGWFGVAPRKHWSRHTGYYRNYTQWSAR